MAKSKRSLSASSAERWFNCPGSVDLCTKVPKPKSSDFAVEGTDAHQLAEHCINNRENPIDMVGEVVERFKWGENTGEEFVVTQDMAEAVKIYCDWFDQETEGLHSSNYALEQEVVLSNISPELRPSYLDCVIKEPYGTLTICDYKHGAGKLVDPFQNLQLLYYALGAAIGELPDGVKCFDHDAYEKVRLAIVQPRAFDSDESVRVWELSFDELLDKWWFAFADAVEATVDSKVYVEGDWCKWCPAQAFCPQKEKDLVPKITNPVVDLSLMPLKKCASVVASKSMISDFVKACEARVEMEMIEFGNPVEGFKVVKKRKTKRWADETQAATSLLDMFDESEVSSKKLKSPSMVKKTLGDAALEGLLAEDYDVYTVAPSSDRRKEVTS